MYKTLNTNSDKKIGHYLINLKLSRIGKLEVRRQKGEYAGYIKKRTAIDFKKIARIFELIKNM